MTDKELKRLSRSDLLELLIAQSRETERLQKLLQTANERLASRDLSLEKAGSIAEAALQVSGVFTAAQEAAALYLENIHALSASQEANCAQREAECAARCRKLESDTQARCEAMLTEAEKTTQTYWTELKAQMNAFLDAHAGLREILAVQGWRDIGK